MSDFPTESSITESYRTQAMWSQVHAWIGAQASGRQTEAEGITSSSTRFELNAIQCNIQELTTAVMRSPIHEYEFNGVTHLTPIETSDPASHRPTRLTVDFDPTSEMAPSISAIGLTQGAQTGQPVPVPAHRILSLKHRWHALVESPKKYPRAFQQIITPEFSMDWGYGSATGFEELSAWVQGSASTVSAARHDISEFEWSATNNTYEARFVFDWYGYSQDKRRMRAQSQHHWQISDNPHERFARLNKIQVEFLTPFYFVTGDT